MCPGVDSASKNEYQDTPGSKAGRCVRLMTYHLLVLLIELKLKKSKVYPLYAYCVIALLSINVVQYF
jgi:hypothetical protein